MIDLVFVKEFYQADLNNLNKDIFQKIVLLQ